MQRRRPNDCQYCGPGFLALFTYRVPQNDVGDCLGPAVVDPEVQEALLSSAEEAAPQHAVHKLPA